jgi:hypothetical protein
MSAKNAIEKLQRIAREKETQRSEHKRRHEEEELLRKTELKKELRRTEKEGTLNIQPLAIRLPSHSSSSKCVEGKAYNVNIQFR